MVGCTWQRSDLPLFNRVGVVDPKATLPPVPREFRAVWVATVGNIDWPSKAGLSSDVQQAELRAILDKAVALHLNAIVLQVRCACDALYASELEPWSAYLSGTQGEAPQPPYDPLAFAVAEAHARGLELHAWFNPFRAKPAGAKSIAPTHVSQTHPDWVRQYGDFLWLDPGVAEARAYSLEVFRDVIRRYDIDGVHVDDYFYPYPIRDEAKKVVDFPDDAPWQQYKASGGALGRSDWRRDNINTFMQGFYDVAHAERSDVKVGISPFGIWRPGNPEQIKGFDAYESLYADARLWLQEGWCDYITPQLYWQIDPPAQSYPVLLRWWAQQNKMGRHLWAGNFIGKVGDGESNWPPSEIVNQIRATRAEPGAGGNVYFSMKTLMRNREGVADLVKQEYAMPALPPATPWLDNSPPRAPKTRIGKGRTPDTIGLRITAGDRDARVWVIQTRYGEQWELTIAPAGIGGIDLPAKVQGVPADWVAVRAADRSGNMSAAVVIR
jgi:uncharacterized lipoprotein YddW (UPF0748 family)